MNREDLVKKIDGELRNNYNLHTNVTKDEISKIIDIAETHLARKVFNVGHNLDCVFCGFKDRIVKEHIFEKR